MTAWVSRPGAGRLSAERVGMLAYHRLVTYQPVAIARSPTPRRRRAGFNLAARTGGATKQVVSGALWGQRFDEIVLERGRDDVDDL